MRVVFLCNLCFITTLFIRVGYGNIDIGWVSGLLIVLGTLGAYVSNGLLHFVLLVLYLGRREQFKSLPSWLLWSNGLIAITQLLLLFFLQWRL